MDSILTPRIFPLPPSAFMTPPDSDEKRVIHHVYQTPRPLPHLSVLLSPDDTPPRYLNKASELVDVLTELIDRGIKHTADYILSFLSPSDLVGCTQVSLKWHEMVTSRHNLMDKVTSYRRLCKSKAENPLKSVNKPFSHQTRQPLSSISANIQRLPSNLPSSSLAPPSTKHTHYRPCPHCQSKAKELNLRRAVCTKCKLDFCMSCFDQWHEGECPMRSPKRPARSTSIAGTQLCKKRLRRL